MDVARFLLKVGGGSEAKKRIWQVTRLAPFEADEAEMLAEAVREGTAAGEEFAVRLEELRIPIELFQKSPDLRARWFGWRQFSSLILT